MKCSECQGYNVAIFTETTFGHGDSSHVCYVKCRGCGKKGPEFEDYGLFDDKTFRKAQAAWNLINEEYGKS